MMKCKGCGAILEMEQSVCPYCGMVNPVAAEQARYLNLLKRKNQNYRAEVLKESRTEILKRIHKRVNWILFGVLVIVTVLSFLLYGRQEYHQKSGTAEQMEKYYREGDYRQLYLYMNDCNLYDPDKHYEYGQMALFFRTYQDCQDSFAEAYEDYLQTGRYSGYGLEKCIRNGYDVLTAYVSYVYEDVGEENRQKLLPYQEQVRILFAGSLKIPEEMLLDLQADDYECKRKLIAYVKEVLPCD